MNGDWLRGLLARPTVCRCGHTADAHEHWRAGSDCGTCGPDVCSRYRRTRRRPRPAPVDLHAVCRDDQLLDAVNRGDLDTARRLADDVFVQLLAGWRDDCRRGEWLDADGFSFYGGELS